MPLPENFANFDVAGAETAVWVFRKSGGHRGAAPTFTGHWIAIDAALEAAVKEAISTQRARIEEVSPYGLLAQNHEASALSIAADETHVHLVAAATAEPLPQRRATKLAHLQNTSFYVIKLSVGGETLLAFRKTDSSWHTKRRRASIDALFGSICAIASRCHARSSLSRRQEGQAKVTHR